LVADVSKRVSTTGWIDKRLSAIGVGLNDINHRSMHHVA
jgi:hypothetical protein